MTRALSPVDLHAKIYNFLREEFARKEGRQCVQLELLRGKGTGFGTDSIASWDRKENPEAFDTLAEIENLASKILDRAESETTGNGSHVFTLRTHQHLGGRQTCRFTIVIEEDSGDGANDLEPTVQGQTALMMRGFDTMLKTNEKMFGSSLQVLGGIANRQGEELVSLRRENEELRRKNAELETNQLEREWNVHQKQLAEDRKGAGFQKLLQLGNVVMSRVAGDAAGANGGMLSSMVSDFADSLNPQQQGVIGQALQGEQRMMLMEIVRIAKTSLPPAPETKTIASEKTSNGSH